MCVSMHGDVGCVFSVWHLNHVLFKSSLIVMFAELRMSEHASHMRSSVFVCERVCVCERARVCRAECHDIRFISMYIMCARVVCMRMCVMSGKIRLSTYICCIQSINRCESPLRALRIKRVTPAPARTHARSHACPLVTRHPFAPSLSCHHRRSQCADNRTRRCCTMMYMGATVDVRTSIRSMLDRRARTSPRRASAYNVAIYNDWNLLNVPQQIE